jgi:predicted NAD/FAD-dependent oxidoreductase
MSFESCYVKSYVQQLTSDIQMAAAMHAVVIGAGITGLSAAHTLCALGFYVVLLDKGTSVGGRMATRYFDGEGRRRRYIDTASKEIMLNAGSTDAFKSLLVQNQLCSAKDTRVAGQPGLNAFAKAFAQRLPQEKHEVVTGCTVSRISYDKQTASFTITAKMAGRDRSEKGFEEKTFSGQGVILTAPVQQSIKLIEQDFSQLMGELSKAPEYEKSINLLLWPKSSSIKLKEHANVQYVRQHSHIQANVEAGCIPLSVRATTAWSETHYEDKDSTEVEDLLLSYIDQPRDAFDKIQLKKWKYSQPKVDAEQVRRSGIPGRRADPDGCPLVVASDGLGPGLIGEAGEAGIQAANFLHQQLTSSSKANM